MHLTQKNVKFVVISHMPHLLFRWLSAKYKRSSHRAQGQKFKQQLRDKNEPQNRIAFMALGLTMIRMFTSLQNVVRGISIFIRANGHSSKSYFFYPLHAYQLQAVCFTLGQSDHCGYQSVQVLARVKSISESHLDLPDSKPRSPWKAHQNLKETSGLVCSIAKREKETAPRAAS